MEKTKRGNGMEPRIMLSRHLYWESVEEPREHVFTI